MIISFIFFILLASFVLAMLEIQIEGKDGWAQNLPTWRMKNKFTRLLYGDLELTGYHFWLILTLLWFLHSVFILTSAWSLSLELIILSAFCFIWMVEDFLWFVLNPAYGIKKFAKPYISWHHKWMGPIPISYPKFFMAGIILFGLSFFTGGSYFFSSSPSFLLMILFGLVGSFFVAQLEIQIEGKYGWVEKLPTWRIHNKITRAIFGGRPLTGYHAWITTYIVLMLQAGFFLGAPFHWYIEFQILAAFVLAVLFEDFFWFLLNPFYGLKKFNKVDAHWHVQWVGVIPMMYIDLLTLFTLFFIASIVVS